MQKDIQELIDQKIETLFSKPPKKKYDPLFTEEQNKLKSIFHTATIMHGHVLEAAYLNAVKIEKKEYNVWSEKEFCISEDAHNKSKNQTSKRILESTEPYGECMLVGKKKNPRKIQIDIIVYNKDLEEISAYEVKRGGSPHDRGKKESIISDVIAVQVLLKDYAEQKKFKVKKTKSLIISHYGATLTRPEWRDLQINGENIDNHFNANISSYLKETEEYWIKSFNREYKKIL